MAWRTTFKKTCLTEFKKIDDVGYVGSKWMKDPLETNAITMSLTTEEYERTMGSSAGVVRLWFEILGKVRDLDDSDEAKEELLDAVIEKMEVVTTTLGYDLIFESTDFHDKIEGGGTMFTLSGYIVIQKDYSGM